MALVVAELALAVILVVGSGLLLRSFSNLTNTNPGLNPDQMLTFDLALPFFQYQEFDQIADFYQNLLRELEAVPMDQGAVEP